ncbi:hypothetical protein [Shewanella sedimentimangrovi]|uniref:DUF1579 domain-containing protein n=1 Tax=Shewanella sedimentimangrovi TaxID=2814293 RepID=A0ABX7R292_9GAMM|nr:hypothetical protein [Shewanella sedimentimangrovi]QSX36951.1 hypothetical protein JYB85_17080 [Shewanella sedimentimangrovi]
MRILKTAVAGLFVLATNSYAEENSTNSATQATLLQALEGKWIMVGDVMGKPVQYDMEAFATLQGTFTEMHMNDVQVPSEYEARVFISVDKEGKVIAHWLDSFGGKYSVPHGTGQVTGNSLVFHIPYTTGVFRDTLVYDQAHDSWKLTIEGQEKDGTWDHFAKYEITRK